MELNKKLLLIAKRYDVFINTTSYPQTMCDLFKKVMIKAYEYHKYDVSFEEFIRNFTENPVEYAYQMSEKMEQK